MLDADTGTAPRRRPAPDDALDLARTTWMRGERLDMRALAGRLGIGRVTLYRWFGSRELLLVEVVWDLAQRLLEDVAGRAQDSGPERVVRIVVDFLDGVIRSRGMRSWLADEGELAMRLLTRYDTGFQPRLIAAVEGLLVAEAATGRLELDADLHEVAYVVVRLIESYTYLDLITGEQPEAARAEPILRMLLRAPAA